MVTDGWDATKAKFARILGRGNHQDTADAAAELEQSRANLSRLSGAALAQAQKEQAVEWSVHLGELLQHYPSTEIQLRTLVADIQSSVISTGGPVEQRVMGFDHAQQAVLGHGVQNVDFGRQGDDGDRE
jgi:hypothetical protein